MRVIRFVAFSTINAIAFLTIVPLSQAQLANLVVTDQETGKTVVAWVQQPVQVQLKSNISTGYTLSSAWAALNALPIPNGPNNIVTLTPFGPEHFFRLRK